MPRAHVDTSQLEALARDLDGSGRSLKRRARQVLQKVAFDVERNWKTRAPVLTGRYRASIGHYTPGDLVQPNAEASADDAYWTEDDSSVEIGTNVSYAEALAAGHSRQMPSGTVESVWLEGERALEAGIAALIEQAAVGR